MRFVKDILDANLKDTLNKASQAFAIRSVGLIIHYLFNVYLARLFGAKGTGTYYLAFTIITIGSLLGRFGLDNALIRFTAVNFFQKNNSKVKGIYVFSLTISIVLSLAITMILYIMSPLISTRLFDDPSLEQPLKCMVFSIIPLSLLHLIAAMLKGIENIRDSILISGALIPLFTLLIAFIIQDSFGIVGIMIAYNISTIIVFLYSFWRWHSNIPTFFSLKTEFVNKEIIAAGIPLFGIALLNLFIYYSNTFILGIYADTALVGIFNVALRTTALTSILLTAINSIIAPKFARLYDNNEIASLEKLARNTAFLITVLSGLILAVFIVIPKFIMSIFGEEFIKGSNVLVILSLGQFLNSATGSVGYLLMMTGNEKLLRNNIAIIAVLSILLNFLLVPRYNIIGAALATAFCLALMNFISTYLVYKKTSILVIPAIKK